MSSINFSQILNQDKSKQENPSGNSGDRGDCLDADDYDYISPEMLSTLRDEARAKGTSEEVINHLYPLEQLSP